MKVISIQHRNTLHKALVLFLSQVAAGLLLYEIGRNVWQVFHGDFRNNLGWGITLYYVAAPTYLALCLAVTGFAHVVRDRRIAYWVAACGYGVFVALLINQYTYTPNRITLLFISAFIGIFMPMIFTPMIFLLRKRNRRYGSPS